MTRKTTTKAPRKINSYERAAAFDRVDLDGYPPMTGREYVNAAAKLDLTQRDIGKFLRSTRRTSSRWAVDASPIPVPVAMLLRLMIKLKIKPEDVENALL